MLTREGRDEKFDTVLRLKSSDFQTPRRKVLAQWTSLRSTPRTWFIDLDGLVSEPNMVRLRPRVGAAEKTVFLWLTIQISVIRIVVVKIYLCETAQHSVDVRSAAEKKKGGAGGGIA